VGYGSYRCAVAVFVQRHKGQVRPLETPELPHYICAMRALLSAIAVIALASPALAVDWWKANKPPVEYRHEADQTYLIAEWPHDLLGAVCSNGGLQWIREGNHGGCFVRDKEDRSFAYIYVLAGLAPDQRECVIIHEKAHLNGWTH